MAAKIRVFPADSRVQTPSLYFTASAFTHFRLSNFSCYTLPQKSANNSLFLSCRCRCGALAINGYQATSVYTGSGIMLFQLFQGMGFSAKETEAILRRNPALRLTPFESIRSRIQFLQSAGVDGLALSGLIAKRPPVLIAKEIDELLCFTADDDDLELKGKIKPSQIVRLLNGTDPALLVGLERKVRLLHQFGISKEKLVHVLNAVNLRNALCFKLYEEMESVLALFYRLGAVDLIVRRPVILNYDLETRLMPRIRFLLELSGGDEKSTATILRKCPTVLTYTDDHMKDQVEFLKSHTGLSYAEIFGVILVYPSVFSISKERKLRPRIDFLKECGLNSDDIYRFLIKAPLFLGLSFEENLANKLVFLVKIGYKNRTKELAMAVGAVTRCSCRNLQEVIGVFLNYGLTFEDILDMSKKRPQVLKHNFKSLEQRLGYLIEELA